MYSLIAVLAGLALLRSLPSLADDPLDAVVMIVLLGAVLTLAILLRNKLFPGLRFFGIKTNPAGRYVLG